MSDQIERAIHLANLAHNGIVHLDGQPAILHALRVMLAVHAAKNDPVLTAAAVLHDVIEDSSGWTMYRLIDEGINARTADLVQILTRTHGDDTYMDYIRRIARNEDAQLIKWYDLMDNLHRPGLKSLKDRYTKALAVLGDPSC